MDRITVKNMSIKRIAIFGIIISLAAAITTNSSVHAEPEEDLKVWLQGTTDYNFANEILIEVNKKRKNAGLSQLYMDEEKMKSANVRARECILRYSHSRPVSSKWTSLIQSGYSHAGENLAIGYNNAEDVVEAWMDSPTHKSNILGSDYKTIGIGVFKYTNSITGKTSYTCAQ